MNKQHPEAAPVKKAAPDAAVANERKAPFRSSMVKVDVECEKCGRKFETDFFPFAPHPMVVRTQGAELKPYLREILAEEFGPFGDLIPCQPPITVISCSVCPRRVPIPCEGDTFKKRTYRGKFKTIGREKNSPGAELDPDNTYDLVDQTLTVAHLKSRYGKGIDDANNQAAIRERLFSRDQLEHAKEVLEGLSLREIEKNLGIPRMTASRGKEAIHLLANMDKAPDHE